MLQMKQFFQKAGGVLKRGAHALRRVPGRLPKLDFSSLFRRSKREGANALKRKSLFCSAEAAAISIGIHLLLLIFAGSIVAIRYAQKQAAAFSVENIERPKLERRQLQMPVKVQDMQKKSQRPKVTTRMATAAPSTFALPDMAGLGQMGGFGRTGSDDGSRDLSKLGSAGSLGFGLHNVDFFGAKAKGEKIVFVVHFGPATIGTTPFSRMTGYTIRKRLEDMVNRLPGHTLFNVVCYYAGATWAMEPKMMLASADNKQKVKEWMAPVNPLEGNYDHCFAGAPKTVNEAATNYPRRVDNLPFYAPKWVYPYVVPVELEQKYVPGSKGFMHWGRAVAWAILTQQPDTIFVLTTNYIDGWGDGMIGRPDRMAAAFRQMCFDIYGPDQKKHPTINVVVLALAGAEPANAYKVLNEQFGPIWNGFRGAGSVIEDISKYMNNEEKELMQKYQHQKDNPQPAGE